VQTTHTHVFLLFFSFFFSRVSDRSFRVARWFAFKPKIQICVNFGWRDFLWEMLVYFTYGQLVHFTVFCYILWRFGIVRGNLVYFFPFWYFVPRKIWQPCVPSPAGFLAKCRVHCDIHKSVVYVRICIHICHCNAYVCTYLHRFLKSAYVLKIMSGVFAHMCIYICICQCMQCLCRLYTFKVSSPE
jgi:hypothetical protein